MSKIIGYDANMNRRNRKTLISQMGGCTQVARAFSDRGSKVTRQAVERWIRDGIPAERVRVLSELSGKSPAEIRPDLYGWL